MLNNKLCFLEQIKLSLFGILPIIKSNNSSIGACQQIKILKVESSGFDIITIIIFEKFFGKTKACVYNCRVFLYTVHTKHEKEMKKHGMTAAPFPFEKNIGILL